MLETAAMRTALIGLLVAVSITGCSTAGNVLSRQAALTLHSDKAASEVTGCAAPLLLKSWPTTRQLSQGRGTVILVSGDAFGGVVSAVEVMPSESGSEVVIRHGAGAGNVLESIDDQVRTCL